MTLPGRNGSLDSYRYGFQGQEKDDEIKGEGNSLNYKYRMHDPRVGRFFAVDPLAREFAFNSPFAFSENRVLDRVELEGLESWEYTEKIKHDKDDTKVITYTKILGNVGAYALDLIPYVFNNIEMFGRGGPAKVWEYHEDMLNDMSTAIANDMIQSKKSGEFENGEDYLVDRIQRKEVLEVGISVILTRRYGTPSKANITSSVALSRAQKFADLLLESPFARSNTKMPRSVTAVYDRVTGKIYLGESGVLKAAEITPELQKLLPKKSKTAWPNVENCSECHALNNAFKDGAKAKNLEIHTIEITKPLKDSKGRILESGSTKSNPACDNCKVTTKTVKRNTSG